MWLTDWLLSSDRTGYKFWFGTATGPCSWVSDLISLNFSSLTIKMKLILSTLPGCALLITSNKIMHVKWMKLLGCVWLFATPWTVAHQHFHPWNFPGKNTGVCCHFLLQRFFLTQGLNLGLPKCRQELYCLSHQGSPQCKAFSKLPDA